MTALNVLVQRDAVHVMTDGLLYAEGQVIQTDFPKCIPLRGMKAAVAACGPARFPYLVATVLESDCSSFDQVVKTSKHTFDGMFDYFLEHNPGNQDVCSLVLAGWLDGEQRPAAFSIEFDRGGAHSEWVKQNNPESRPEDSCSDLTELPIIAIPPVPVERLIETGWPIGQDCQSLHAECDLLHLMELQRHKQMDDGRSYVGGAVLLTSITSNGVTQRQVHCWREDRAGKRIKPRPIDWASWRRKYHHRREICA